MLPPGSFAYIAPYATFMALVSIARGAPMSLALRVAIPALLLFVYWRRGAFPELAGYRASRATLADVAVGIAIAGIWLAPYLLVPALPRGSAFDPNLFGPEHRTSALGLRLVGFAVVTPFMEELFVRSFLARWLATSARGDFRGVTVGVLSKFSFWATALWFAGSHAPWEWPVALPTGIAFNLWLMRRRHLGACIVAHATANAAIWTAVVLGPGPLWEFL